MIRIIDLALENVLKLYLRKICNYAYNFNIKKYHEHLQQGPAMLNRTPGSWKDLEVPLGVYTGEGIRTPQGHLKHNMK